jgi:hypothetical protein
VRPVLTIRVFVLVITVTLVRVMADQLEMLVKQALLDKVLAGVHLLKAVMQIVALLVS